MTIKAVTYYEVCCDEPDCKDHPDDEYSAYADESYAADVVIDFEWSTDGQGHHWCHKHRPPVCEGEHVRDDPEDACKRCRQWPEDDVA